MGDPPTKVLLLTCVCPEVRIPGLYRSPLLQTGDRGEICSQIQRGGWRRTFSTFSCLALRHLPVTSKPSLDLCLAFFFAGGHITQHSPLRVGGDLRCSSIPWLVQSRKLQAHPVRTTTWRLQTQLGAGGSTDLPDFSGRRRLPWGGLAAFRAPRWGDGR